MPQKITINSRSSGNYSEEVLNNRAHIVTEMMSIEGDSIMNGLFYPDDQVTNSFKQLDMKPAPAGHPTANGENISAFHPLAMNAFNVGGFIRNSRKEGKRVFNELVFDLEVAERDDRGTEIVNRIRKGQKIGVSTGLNASVISNGDKREVRDIQFDHVAVLLDEKPAGENTFTVNEELIICNMGEPLGDPKTNLNREVNDMDKEKLVLGIIANSANGYTMADKDALMSMSEDALVNALHSKVKHPEPTLEAAKSVVEGAGLCVNAQDDKEGYSEYLANKEAFDSFKADLESKRKVKIEEILANSKMNADSLNGVSEEFLNELHESFVTPKGDYSAQGPLLKSNCTRARNYD
jgi:hypothetical protein